MGKRAKPSPFAPLERDVDPPLRKLSFVRARYVSTSTRVFPELPRRPRVREAPNSARGAACHSADGAGAPTLSDSRSLEALRARADLGRPAFLPAPLVQRRRADPPLISEEAQRRMIVLDARQDARADANGHPPRGESRERREDDGTRDDDGADDDVPNPLYPRSSAHFSTRWPSVRRVGAGLANLGNTCFLNAVTQCLTHTPPLASFCLAGEHRKHRKHRGGFDAVYEMGEHICRALGGGEHADGGARRAIAPLALVKNLRSVSKTFRKGRQEDAHEFARCVLDAMHKKCCDVAAPRAKEGSRRSETSFVWRAFGGTLRSRITCQTCGRASDKFDGFMDLSLDIARAKSVSHALRSYVATEVLDGANKYKCEMAPNGKAHMTRATKQFTIEKAPLILTVQLKRFEYVPFGRGKLNQFVEYPLALDLSAAMSGANESAEGGRRRHGRSTADSPNSPVAAHRNARETYSLFGVVVHSGGSMHSGHYYCYVKGPTGHWYEMDDETVTQCGESTALKQRAYLLFYAKNESGPGARGDAGPAAAAAAQAAAKKANGAERRVEAEKDDRPAKRRGSLRDAEEDAPAPTSKPSSEKKKARAQSATQAKAERGLSAEPDSGVSAKRRERIRAAGADAEALETLPGSPSDSERSNGAARSPRRGGKLLSSRDSARLRLISKRLRRDRDNKAGLSPVKTRAARRAEKERASSRNERPRETSDGKTAVLAANENADAADANADGLATVSETFAERRERRRDVSDTSDPKSVKRWLSGSARASNTVGRGARGGDGGGWDDEREHERPREARSQSKENAVPKRRRVVEDPKASLSSKRRRAYDEIDEEYDRGRVSKHARRREAKHKAAGKARVFGSNNAGEEVSRRNPFQSKARSKASAS